MTIIDITMIIIINHLRRSYIMTLYDRMTFYHWILFYERRTKNSYTGSGGERIYTSSEWFQVPDLSTAPCPLCCVRSVQNSPWTKSVLRMGTASPPPLESSPASSWSSCLWTGHIPQTDREMASHTTLLGSGSPCVISMAGNATLEPQSAGGPLELTVQRQLARHSLTSWKHLHSQADLCPALPRLPLY